jgi:hypothetical protein
MPALDSKAGMTKPANIHQPKYSIDGFVVQLMLIPLDKQGLEMVV